MLLALSNLSDALRRKSKLVALICLLSPMLSTCLDTTTYDLIIVGGGTAGLVIAERVSSNPNISVAVLEAGQWADSDTVEIPALFENFIGDPIVDWGFTSTPQGHALNRTMSLPRGKAVGGTSAVNGMYYVLASEKEYNVWEDLGNTGWNWSTVHSYANLMETFTPAPSEDATNFGAIDVSEHGSSGPINVSFSNYWAPTEVNSAWAPALSSLGIPINDQAASGNTLGSWQAPCSIKPDNRSRSYAGDEIFRPALGRSNLVLLTGAEVTKIVLDEELSSNGSVVATGVEYIDSNGATDTIGLSSGGEVIVSAGTYQSPKILELSGIGNATILEQYGITARLDLDTVGENLQDHYGVLTSFELKSGTGQTYEDLSRNTTFAALQEDLYTTNRSGVPSTTLAFFALQDIVDAETLQQLLDSLDSYLGGFAGTAFEKQLAAQRDLFVDPSVPDFELVMLPGLNDATLTTDPSKEYLTISFNSIRPFSRGRVHISSSNASELPEIDVNYLGFDAFDVAMMAAGASFVVDKLAQTSPLSDYIDTVLRPLTNSTDDDLAQFVRSSVFSVWHPCGSTSMLPADQGGVVDSQLKVYGTENIRVADAGIIPVEVGTHTMATVYANALKAAELWLCLKDGSSQLEVSCDSL
ncbi:alcohol oxidase [Stereum hirsutum FP-91666 SS1]|uniref:alcohol oxidase n=1 Tax=Stereum hirsutum (strain FP-91666) TaxID=721885 RepID=UPI000440CE3E|nr:alcohol oxidase [Stereum hirsutum FP-91666 SS1]EIM87885.1 alcohol oxidase [Stereum hirsutum FP-91666 SS1]